MPYKVVILHHVLIVLNNDLINQSISLQDYLCLYFGSLLICLNLGMQVLYPCLAHACFTKQGGKESLEVPLLIFQLLAKIS